MKLSIEQIQLFNQLPPRDQAYAMAVLSGLSPEKAYKRATGMYNPLAAAQMLEKPGVVRFIKAVRDEELQNCIVTRDEALRILSNIARANPTDVLKFETIAVGEGEAQREYVRFGVRDLSQVDAAQAGLVESISETKDGVKVKLYSKTEAIKQMRAMCGWDSVDEAMIEVLKGDLPLVEVVYVAPPGRAPDDVAPRI